jgi:hypothetical protein
MTQRTEPAEPVSRRRRAWEAIKRHDVALLYVLIVALIVLGFRAQSERDRKACLDAQATRDAMRGIVTDLADSARANGAADTPAGKAALEAYVRTSLEHIPRIKCPR